MEKKVLAIHWGGLEGYREDERRSLCTGPRWGGVRAVGTEALGKVAMGNGAANQRKRAVV